MQLELPVGDGLAQIELQSVPGPHPGVHLGLEKTVNTATVGLRAVQGHIGILEKLIGVGCIGWCHGDTHAHSNHDLLAVDFEGRPEDRHDAGGQCCCGGWLRQAALDDAEFVTAETCDAVGSAQAFAQPLADLAQELVTDRMSQCVIDHLEVIEVEPKNGEGLIATQLEETIRDFLVELDAIGQTGQRIVQGHVLDLGLGLASLGNVFMRDHPAAAALHGSAGDGNFPPVRGCHDRRGGFARCQVRQHFGAILFEVAVQGNALGAVLQSSCTEQPGLIKSRDSPYISM